MCRVLDAIKSIENKDEIVIIGGDKKRAGFVFQECSSNVSFSELSPEQRSPPNQTPTDTWQRQIIKRDLRISSKLENRQQKIKLTIKICLDKFPLDPSSLP